MWNLRLIRVGRLFGFDLQQNALLMLLVMLLLLLLVLSLLLLVCRLLLLLHLWMAILCRWWWTRRMLYYRYFCIHWETKRKKDNCKSVRIYYKNRWHRKQKWLSQKPPSCVNVFRKSVLSICSVQFGVIKRDYAVHITFQNAKYKTYIISLISRL